MNDNYNIPILYICFNRPDVVRQSFDCIRKVKPSKLYVVSDGARDNIEGEADLVSECRSIITSSIDWDCEVKTLFQSVNLGCGIGVFTAINWLFDNENCGVIIEDDCICNDSFFKFMEEMLQRYENDHRIGMVAGSNLIDDYCNASTSYFFSRYKSCWGWGTWKRAWQNMDITMKWRETDKNDVLSNSGYYRKGLSKWKYQLKCIDANYVSAWDWQWYFTLSAQNQLCIYPKANLVSNIGIGENATHTSHGDITHEAYCLDFPLVHPAYIVPNEAFDKCFYKSENRFLDIIKRLFPLKLKSQIKKLIH